MIFYFSGTGNSLYVARRLGEAIGGELHSMPRCIVDRNTSFTLEPGERVGFVFPTHVWGTPWIVDDFVDSLHIEPAHGYGTRESRLDSTYTFAVITYGSSTGDAANTFKNALARRGMSLDLVYSVRMPENYVLGADTPEDGKVAHIQALAERRIDAICLDVIDRNSGSSVHKGSFSLLLARTHSIYKHYGCKTEDFFADDSCTSCGKCVDICESDIIAMGEDGKPRWTLGKCSFCLGCINRCPEEAIQYGSRTSGRRRYANPLLPDE